MPLVSSLGGLVSSLNHLHLLDLTFDLSAFNSCQPGEPTNSMMSEQHHAVTNETSKQYPSVIRLLELYWIAECECWSVKYEKPEVLEPISTGGESWYFRKLALRTI
jgi:hypothetical protein